MDYYELTKEMYKHNIELLEYYALLRKIRKNKATEEEIERWLEIQKMIYLYYGTGH